VVRGLPATAKQVLVLVVAEAVVTLATPEDVEEQADAALQEHQQHLTAYQYPQEQQHPLQLVVQGVKLSYHGIHNNISTRYLLRW
jgi:hypothetical protein